MKYSQIKCLMIKKSSHFLPFIIKNFQDYHIIFNASCKILHLNYNKNYVPYPIFYILILLDIAQYMDDYD